MKGFVVYCTLLLGYMLVKYYNSLLIFSSFPSKEKNSEIQFSDKIFTMTLIKTFAFVVFFSCLNLSYMRPLCCECQT